MTDFEEKYQEFWRDIIEPDGLYSFDQVKRELFDYGNMIENVSLVYDHITRGAISEPNTDAIHVIKAFDSIVAEYDNRCCENCKFYKNERGKQRDGMDWETKECEFNMWDDAEFTQTGKISCPEWESKV